MANSTEVVITGLGIVSPIGIGRDAFWQALLAGESGVGPISHFDASQLPVRIGAELKDFEPKLYIKPRKSLKVMSREIQMGVAAAQLAVEDAGLDVARLDHERFGVVLGSQMLYGELHELRDLYANCMRDGEFHFAEFGGQFPQQLFPLWLLKYLPNMTASHIGIAHGARGPNNSLVLGEVSSLLAIIEAATLISRGAADVMLSGGGGSRVALTPLMYRGDLRLSHRNHEPAEASRPFDADRDGMVNGEGAATLVLESREHAEGRGAAILGTIRGHGMTHAGSATGRAGRVGAIEAALRRALASAGLTAEHIGHVNAHGLGTRTQDACEARAIHAVLGDVPVTAPKSLFGNLGAGGGAVELCASLLGRVHRQIPPTRNYRTPDPDCPVNVVVEPRPMTNPAFAAMNQSGTGQAAALVIT